MIKKLFTIFATKYDGSIHRSWTCEFLEKTDSLLVFYGVFEKEMIHEKLGKIKAGTISYEYYWLDKYFNVFLFREPNGDFRNFYCNINVPPTIKGNSLQYIDLDIDIIVWKDFNSEIIDLEEFEENSIVYNYPADLKLKIENALDDLKKLINNREFPFNLT